TRQTVKGSFACPAGRVGHSMKRRKLSRNPAFTSYSDAGCSKGVAGPRCRPKVGADAMPTQASSTQSGRRVESENRDEVVMGSRLALRNRFFESPLADRDFRRILRE